MQVDFQAGQNLKKSANRMCCGCGGNGADFRLLFFKKDYNHKVEGCLHGLS